MQSALKTKYKKKLNNDTVVIPKGGFAKNSYNSSYNLMVIIKYL
jgi:hypothetical protein